MAEEGAPKIETLNSKPQEFKGQEVKRFLTEQTECPDSTVGTMETN